MDITVNLHDKMTNIVFLDARTLSAGDISWNALQRLGHFTAYDRTQPDEVMERAAEADVLILNKTRLQREHFQTLPRLKLVCVAASGYDVVDVSAAREHGVTVCNCAGYGTGAVAQMVVALLLEVTNRVGRYAEADRQGFWCSSKDFCRWDEPLMELAGRRLAVVGFGHIGRAVTDLLRPFGMRLGVVTSKSAADLPADVVRLTLEEAFAESDVVSLNCPLTPENRAFVNAALLSAARPGLILINTARGGLVAEQAVAEALARGTLGAYCADVLAKEPPSADNPLLSTPRTFVTPHIAWATAEARLRILDTIVRNIGAFLQGRPQNVVN